MKHNIILIGFMGCGKSTVGKKLANAFSYRFLDTDTLIEERGGKKISQIFEEEGEEAFRQAETELLKKLLLQTDKAVIATGGGMPMREENRRYLRQMGTVVFLKADIETLLERLKSDTERPLAAGSDREKRLRALYQERLLRYKEAAELWIDTDGKSFYRIIQEIEQYIKAKEK